jgi:alkanesulfonate monooxygenase SsuD/methylene tetrahydromethanopterin reductase-like flavin-dependent oxidoreductase (luciferase family)
MQFGLQLNSQHPATENMPDRLQELLEQVRLAQAVGFHSIVAPQHYLPAPFQTLQPLLLLARIVAEAKQMRLIAGIMLLSLQNPVALAEDIGTLDAICHGQFTLGVALAYRKPEFQASGEAKADAVSRLIEVLTVPKRPWTEEKVEHQGRFFTIAGVTLTTRPVQHPPGALPQEDTHDLPFDELRDQRFIIGRSDDCVEQLRLYHQRLGANHFLLQVQWVGMPQKQVLEAITLVGERIIPHLRGV